MSKLVLFVCLVIGTVYANTQIRIVNAQYDDQNVVSPGLAANLNDFFNITAIQKSDLFGGYDQKSTTIQASSYQTVPIYSFLVGSPITVSEFNVVDFPSPPITTVDASVENITLVENQSYSFVFIAKSTEQSSFSNSVDVPSMLLAIEERPNPSPTGKALLRIINVAVSTYNTDSMVVNVVGTGGVVNRTVTIPFGQASDFLQYDVAADLTLEFSLPVQFPDPGNSTRTVSVSLVVDHTQVVYIRGDVGDYNQLGSLVTSVDFTFPAAPVSPPVTPPTAEPVSTPAADTPTAPVAATTPTAPTARTPTKRVSSAAQTVAQIAGVAALASLLF